MHGAIPSGQLSASVTPLVSLATDLSMNAVLCSAALASVTDFSARVAVSSSGMTEHSRMQTGDALGDGQLLAEFKHTQQHPSMAMLASLERPAASSNLAAAVSDGKAANTCDSDTGGDLQLEKAGEGSILQQAQVALYNAATLVGSKKLAGQSRRFFEPTMVVSTDCATLASPKEYCGILRTCVQ